MRLALTLQLAAIARVERRLAGKELVEYETQRIQIALHGRLAARQLLRRHVGRRAAANVFRVELARDRRQPEVHDAHFPAGIDHDVRRLEVAVQHAFHVRGRQPRAQLPGDLDPFVDRQSADAFQQRGQIFPVHVLHRQIQLAVRFADVVDAAHVGMRELAREPYFVAEPLAGAFVRTQRGKELERHGLPELEVVGAVHLAHPAAPERRDDAEPAGEQRPGAKAPFDAVGSQRAAAFRTEPWRAGQRGAARWTHRGRHHDLRGSARAVGIDEGVVRLRIRSHHLIDFRSKPLVVRACAIEKRATFGERPLQRRFEDLPDAPEVVRRHGAERRGLATLPPDDV